MSTHQYLTKAWFISAGGIILCGLLAFCSVFAGALGWIPKSPHPPDVTAYLRGARIVIVRDPSSTPPVEQIEVFDDRQAVRGRVPPQIGQPYTNVHLPYELWQAIDALRATWCTTPPQFSQSPPVGSYYEVGLACGSFRTKHIDVPKQQLPPALAELVSTIPIP